MGGTTIPSHPAVLALAVHDDGGRPALFAWGSFSSALDAGDSYLAKWGCLDATAPVSPPRLANWGA
jgi:hypothetical protein